MPELPIQRLDARALEALGIVTPGNYRPRLSETVHAIVSIPLGIAAAAQLGFNDTETDGVNAFSIGVQVNNVPGNFTHSQLKNPSTSGRVVFLDSLYCGSSAAELFTLDWLDTDLTTLVGNGKATKRTGGSSTAQLRSQTAAATLLGATPHVTRFVTTGVNVPEELIFDPPLRLDPGDGVALQCLTVNTTQNISYRWREYIA